MPITFGSVGDIISVSLLVKELLIALNDSRGSSAEYQAVVRELYILDTALLQVEQRLRSHTTTPELQALYETANQTVDKCRDSVSKFTANIRKYSEYLAPGGSGNILKDTTRKIQWRASQKDAAIARFRAEVTGYSNSINMLLATGMVTSLSTGNNDLKDQFAEDSRKTHATLDTHTLVLKEVHVRLEENKELISTGNSLAARMMDRLEWIQKLGSELKRFMSHVIAGNVAIYREVLALHSAFLKHVDRPLGEDPFILEDAIGRVAPVHLRFINSWKAFQAVMEIRFQGKQGLKKICRKEYVLQESATGREVDLSLEFDDAILPGQKITMSLVFKRDATDQSTQTMAHCPRCNMISEQPTNTDVLCSACNMWFCRVIEIQEVDLPHAAPRDTKVHFGQPSFGKAEFGPKPAKRQLEDEDGEDGNYSRFKRIRLISKTKRVKGPKLFTQAKRITFYAPSGSGNNARASSADISESPVNQEPNPAKLTAHFRGLVEEDTLKIARLRYLSTPPFRANEAVASGSYSRTFNVAESNKWLHCLECHQKWHWEEHGLLCPGCGSGFANTLNTGQTVSEAILPGDDNVQDTKLKPASHSDNSDSEETTKTSPDHCWTCICGYTFEPDEKREITCRHTGCDFKSNGTNYWFHHHETHKNSTVSYLPKPSSE